MTGIVKGTLMVRPLENRRGRMRSKMDAKVERWNELQALGALVLAEGDEAYTAFWIALAPELERWLTRGGFLGRVASHPEWQHDILLDVWEKLADRDFAKLRAFYKRDAERKASGRATKSTQPFRAWMRLVVKNLGIDYLRRNPQYIRHRTPKKKAEPVGIDSSPPSTVKHWHSIASLHEGAMAKRDPITIQNTARAMLAFLDESVPARLRRAVELFEADASMSAIASELGLQSEADAERAVCRGQDRQSYRVAMELWSQGFSEAEIARSLGLETDRHARRLVNAAKELLRRHFR